MKTTRFIMKPLVIILIPFLLVMTSVRLLITPVFPQVEYNLPRFPEDEFGFTKTDRLYWSKLAVEYLVNGEGIGFLADLLFEDGTAIFNQRELSHMQDVKEVVQGMIKSWIAIILALILIYMLAYRLKNRKEFWQSFELGGWVTIGLIGLIIITVLTSFDALFIGFHRIFFTGDTWLFYTSDTLIRLFPERFWSDAFFGIGLLSLIGAGLAIFFGKYLVKKY